MAATATARACARLAPLAALALLLVAAPPAAEAREATALPLTGAGAPLDVPGFEALTSSAEARGDQAAFALQLARLVREDPASEAAELALLRLRDALPATAAARPAVRRLLAEALADDALTAGAPDEAGAWRRSRSRDRILSFLSVLYAQEGAWEEARAAEDARGRIPRWLVAGPFGHTHRALHDRAFGPELAQRTEQPGARHSFEGRYGPVGWQPFRMGPMSDTVRIGSLYRVGHGAAYALAQVRGAPGTTARLVVGSSSSFKVWWNGELVADIDRTGAYLPEEVSALIELGEGWQRLLIKCSQGGRGFTARLVADGGATAGGGAFEVAGRDALEPLGTPGTLLSVEALRDAAVTVRDEAALEGAEAAPPLRALRLAAQGLRLARAGLLPDGLELLGEAIALAPGSPHLLHLRARLLEEADHLPEADRRNEVRALLDQAIEAAPGFVPARVRRAELADRDGRTEEAFRALQALMRAHPDAIAVHDAFAQLARRHGFEAEYRRALARMVELEPALVTPRAALAQLYQEQGNAKRAYAMLEEALEHDRAQLDVTGRLARMDVRAGRPAQGMARLEALSARFGDDPALLRVLAQARHEAGRLEGAARAWRRAAEVSGGDPDDLDEAAGVLLERAEVLAGEGRDDEAAATRAEAYDLLQRALAIEPGQWQRRRLAARIAGAPDPGHHELAIPIEEVLASAPDPETFPKAHSVCLLDHSITEVHADGSFTERVHRVIEVRDARGIERYHTLRVPGEILALRTHATDGEVYEPLVTDATREILMPKLSPGARIEVAYRRVQAAPPRLQLDLGPFWLQDPGLTEPYVLSRWDVLVDEGLPLEIVQRNLDGAPERRELEDGRLHYRWEQRMRGRIEPEQLMPEREELLPYVHLLTRRSWQDLAEHHRERFIGRTRLTPELVAAAAEASSGIAGQAAKAEALAAFVGERVREPHGGRQASEILAERAGSRAVLLKALLDAAGVPSRFAVASPNPRLIPPRVWDPPRPDLTPISLLRIEPDDGSAVWYYDGGRYAPYGRVPRGLSGGTALLLSRDGGELTLLPELPLEEDAVESALRIRLEGDGAGLEGELVHGNDEGYRLKEAVEAAQRRQLEVFAEQHVGQLFRRARVHAFDFPDATTAGTPFHFTFEAEAPEVVEERDGRPTLSSGLQPLNLARQLGGRRERTHPMHLRAAQLQRDTVEIELNGRTIESLPDDHLVRGAFGIYSLRFRHQGDTITITRTFAIEPSTIPPEDYPAMLRTLRSIDEAERQRIVLRPAR